MLKALYWAAFVLMAVAPAAAIAAKIDFHSLPSILTGASAIAASWGGLCLHPPALGSQPETTPVNSDVAQKG